MSFEILSVRECCNTSGNAMVLSSYTRFSRIVSDCVNNHMWGSNVRWNSVICCFVMFLTGNLSVKTHLLPISPHHTQRTLPLIWPLTTGAPRATDYWFLGIELESRGPRRLQSKRHCLSLSKTDCRPNNTCSLSLISPFTEWATYPQLSWTFWPFSSCGMHAFPVYRRCPIYSDGSPDDNNLHTPLGVTRPVLVAGSQWSPLNLFTKGKKSQPLTAIS